MKALTLNEVCDPPKFAIEDAPMPVAQKGEAVVRMAAAGLNHRELWIVKGQYPGMALPATLGADGAGTVASVGPGGDDALVGQDVVLYPGLDWGDDPQYPAAQFGLLGMPGPGTIAEYICVPVQNIFPRPAHLDPLQAAALPLATLTAWRGLVTKAGLKSGERLLITGVGGGVAVQALALASAMGVETWVTSGSDDTIAWAVAHGAAGGVNYNKEKWGKELASLAGPIDAVFDGAPASGYPQYGRALAMGARVVIYGSTAGMAFPVNAPELFLKNLKIMGTNVGNIEEFSAMLDFVNEHKLTPEVERVFPFDEAVDAIAFLGEGHSLGKVMIEIAPEAG